MCERFVICGVLGYMRAGRKRLANRSTGVCTHLRTRERL
jgi:hypothetical protein